MKKEFKGNAAGKGDKRRPENFGLLQRNWDAINWHKLWCPFCGVWGDHTSGGCKKLKIQLRLNNKS